MTAGREPTANPPRTRLTWSATSRCGRVHVVVLALGVLTGLFALLASRHLPGALPWSPAARLAIVVGLVAVAQLARLRLRLPSGSVSVTWAEAALIIGLYLVPAGWLPAAAFVGAGAAWLLLAAVSDHTAPAEALYTAASVTLGVCAAVAVTTAFADPLAARVTPELALALALGSLAYLVVTGALASLSLAVHHQVPLRGVLVRALRGKLLMFVGNVVVGLVVISMVDRDPKWLLGLPPALWVLQQTYALRLRGDDERRAWEAFAEATGALNQLDERRVAAAGVTGALTLFGAERVELDVLNPGPVRRYVADPERPVLETAAPAPPDPPAGRSRTTAPGIPRRSPAARSSAP